MFVKMPRRPIFNKKTNLTQRINMTLECVCVGECWPKREREREREREIGAIRT